MFLEPAIRNTAKYLATGDSRNNICQKRQRENINHNLAAISPPPPPSSKKLELTSESRGTLSSLASCGFSCCGRMQSPPFNQRKQISSASSPTAEYMPCSSLTV